MQSTEEIKVGDKVRVSKDAPRIYTQNCLNLSLHNTDFEVANIEDGCANIQNKDGILTIAYVIPTKYLTKVEDEAKAKYKVGDKVRVLGHALLEGGVFTITFVEHREKRGWMYRINTHTWFPESDLAHDIAVKIVNKNMSSNPDEVGEYSVKVAKSVVEGLKRK
ncbi:hypothetical protein [Muribaculum intestinale]|uniref:hypothetical protein n=1 Tax=Muribaculum intestinale TaxID=1796646 RepID=UPI0025B3E8A1|nr:hypothetical protein [Muribaculum intestinale]